MAVDLSNLTTKTALDGAEQVILNDAGVAKDATVDVLSDYVLNKPTFTGFFSAFQSFVSNLASSIGASLVGFIQSGLGAVARTTQEKLREVVSAKDYGATGDGTDETTKVQLAINSLSTGGGFVLVNRGVVYNQASLTIPFNVVLLDEANSRMVFTHTAVQPGILDSHLTFRDIRPNNASRVYLVPNGAVSSGTLSAFKMFGTDYTSDTANYQDFGVYLSRQVATVSAIDTAADTVTSSAHPFGNGDLVRYETTGTDIGGLVANSSYYIVGSTTNAFSLALLAGGSVINLTSAGTGTHSFTKTTGYTNGKVNGNYPQYSLAHSFQDGAQIGLYEFPINTGSGQKMHVALGGTKPSYGVWYDGVRIHLTTDALFGNNKMLRWMDSTGSSAGFGVRVNSSNDLEFLSNSVVVASFQYNSGAPVFKLSKPYAHTRTTGTAGDAAPNVAGISFLQIPSNGTGYSITDFTNAVEGQELVILFSDGNATVQRSATLRLSGGVNFTGSNGAILTLIKGSSGWFEKSRSVNP